MSPQGRVITTPRGAQFYFDAGNFCLELLTSGGPGEYQRYESLHAPQDLAEWLAGSRLSGGALTASDFRISTPDLVAVKQFRDTMWLVGEGLARGERPAAASVEVINSAVGSPPRPRITGDGGRGWVLPISGRQVLAAAAREAVDLITTNQADRVRQCQGERCYLLFLDTSRPGSRRWCSMQRCGNLHKVHEYRRRS